MDNPVRDGINEALIQRGLNPVEFSNQIMKLASTKNPKLVSAQQGYHQRLTKEAQLRRR